MGKKMNLSHLTDEECEQILQVMQKDFTVRRAEKRRVKQVQEQLLKEQQRVAVLSQHEKFNQSNCILCLERFGMFTNRRRKCCKCKMNVCSTCCPNGKRNEVVCSVCSMEKAYKLVSNQWFRDGSSTPHKGFTSGTTKIARSLFKRQALSWSDSEMDSGYPPSTIGSTHLAKPRPPLQNVFDMNMEADGDEENEEDDTFGLSPFPELPAQSPKTPVQGKPVSRATSLEALTVTAGGSPRGTPVHPVETANKDIQASIPGTPIQTQTFSQTQAETQTAPSPPPPLVPAPHSPLSPKVESHSISTETGPDTREFGTSTPTPSRGASTQTLNEGDKEVVKRPRSRLGHGGARPRSQGFYEDRTRRRRDRDTQGLYKEALEGTKRAEEFKFKVKLDRLVGDLYSSLQEQDPDGLTGSFASPSYGEVMLTCRDEVKTLIQELSQRLQLAYESFGSADNPDDVAVQVKQAVTKFIENLIGESLDLTSDEAVSDLSSLSDESPRDKNLYEELLAQAVISKLLENHRKEVNEVLNGERPGDHSTHGLPQWASQGHLRDAREGRYRQRHHSEDSWEGGIRRAHSLTGDSFRNSHLTTEKFKGSLDNLSVAGSDIFSRKSELIPDDDDDDNVNSDNSDVDNVDVHKDQNGVVNSVHENSIVPRNKTVNHVSKRSSGNSHSSKPSLKNSKSDEVPDDVEKLNLDYTDNSGHLGNTNGDANNENISSKVENGHVEEQGQDSETDIVKEFEELKEFVKKTQATSRPKVEAKTVDDSKFVEVVEEPVLKSEVNRDEHREDFFTRYAVVDRVYNSSVPLPDFSEFENINFGTDEIDPDLLSMNLAIIPEETEEELVQEEEEGSQWNSNWIFKGKGISPYENMGRKKVSLGADAPLYMMVPEPEDEFTPRIGNRDVHQLSDSEGDILSQSDGTDEDETSFYPNTSKELARLAKSPYGKPVAKSISSHRSSKDRDRWNGKYQDDDDEEEKAEDVEDESQLHVRGPIVEPSKQDMELLTNLVPAENDDPKFITPPESVTIEEGDPAKFSCRVAGTTPLDVFWYREGDEVEELEPGEDIEMSSQNDRYELTIYNLAKTSGRQYMCIALNDSGKAIQYLVVTVKENKQELKKPEFLKVMNDVEVTEGQSVKLRVKVKGYPQPRISWYKDGCLLKSSKACRLEKFGNRDYMLIMDYVTMNDDAEYTVKAKNVAGEVKASVQVIVEPMSDLPVRRQRVPSITTSGASDSETEKVPRQRLTSAATTAFSSSPLTSSATPAQRTTAATSLRSSPSLQNSLASSSKSPLTNAVSDELQLPDHLPDLDLNSNLQLNHLDRKVTLTQKRVEEEASRMKQDTQKLSKISVGLDTVEARLANLEGSLPSLAALGQEWSLNNPISPIFADGDDPFSLVEGHTQENQVKKGLQEHQHSTQSSTKDAPFVSSSHPSLNRPNVLTNTNTNDNVSQSNGAVMSDNAGIDVLDGLGLPDVLDDFPLLSSGKPKALKSELEISFNKDNSSTPKHQDDPEFWLSPKVTPQKHKSEVSLGPRSSTPNQSNSKPSLTPSEKLELAEPKPVPRNGQKPTSATVADQSQQLPLNLNKAEGSSVASTDSSSPADSPRGNINSQYARDFEVSNKAPEKKKWSVTLDPFVPTADVVNRQNSRGKMSPQELSPSSSLRSSKGDTCSISPTSSSPRQSVDSGVEFAPPPPRLRSAPVHMIGQTAEDEVPESRTEFNTDGSIELPSVNRLKALFSNPDPDPDMGDGGNFRRMSEQYGDIHSITARSVPKEQLEKLKKLGQEQDHSSSNTLQVPGNPSPLTHTTASTATLSLGGAPSHNNNRASSQPQRLNVTQGTSGDFVSLEPVKDPVLIYPETNSFQQQQQSQSNVSLQLQQNHVSNVSTCSTSVTGLQGSGKRSRAPSPPRQGKQPMNSVPIKPPRNQTPKLIVRRASAGDDEKSGGGPRIKSGSISARAAYWERKMMDESGVDEEEFPEMIEESES